jgi:hypothetical protein
MSQDEKGGNPEGIIRIFRAIAVVVCAGLLGYFVYASTTQHRVKISI